MILFDDGNGSTHQINSNREMMKALGVSEGKLLMMTDESGQLVGLGNGSAGMLRSIPVIQAVREEQVMVKSMPTPAPKVLPAIKSHGGLKRLYAELQEMRLNMA